MPEQTPNTPPTNGASITEFHEGVKDLLKKDIFKIRDPLNQLKEIFNILHNESLHINRYFKPQSPKLDGKLLKIDIDYSTLIKDIEIDKNPNVLKYHSIIQGIYTLITTLTNNVAQWMDKIIKNPNTPEHAKEELIPISRLILKINDLCEVN